LEEGRAELRMLTTVEAFLTTARREGLDMVPNESSKLDASGADFRVLQARALDGRPWILRSPRRPDVFERAQMEASALALVRPRVPVEIPEWRVFTRELIAYPRLSGEPAALIDLEAGGYVWRFDATQPPEAFLDTLAAGLAALHRIPVDAAVGAGLRVETPPECRQSHARRMETAREVLHIPDPLWRRWQRWLDDAASWPEGSAVIHGDLHPAHILVDQNHRVSGLLDWTETHVGDPAGDFALLYATLGENALDFLLERYEIAQGTRWPRMRDHIVETWRAYPAMLADFGVKSGEEGPLRLAQSLVDSQP
jgi:macrolide phosphotransferase